MAWSPSRRHASRADLKGRLNMPLFPSRSSRRMSTMRMAGSASSSGAPPSSAAATRRGRRSSVTSPRRARWYETTSGVALPSRTTAPVSRASAEATSRAWYRGLAWWSL